MDATGTGMGLATAIGTGHTGIATDTGVAHTGIAMAIGVGRAGTATGITAPIGVASGG